MQNFGPGFAHTQDWRTAGELVAAQRQFTMMYFWFVQMCCLGRRLMHADMREWWETIREQDSLIMSNGSRLFSKGFVPESIGYV